MGMSFLSHIWGVCEWYVVFQEWLLLQYHRQRPAVVATCVGVLKATSSNHTLNQSDHVT